MPAASKDSDLNGSPIFHDITGVILAGGKSSRFGKNKALVKIDGTPLIERVIGVTQDLFPNLLLVTNTPDEYRHLRIPMQQDLIKGLGPLGGIYTALSVMTHDAGFFVACDMPFLNRELICHMIEIRNGFDAVIPRISGMFESLHSFYHRRCLKAVRELIEARQYQIIRFFDEVSVRYVDEQEIRRFDPNLKSFFNINRPQELKGFTKSC